MKEFWIPFLIFLCVSCNPKHKLPATNSPSDTEAIEEPAMGEGRYSVWLPDLSLEKPENEIIPKEAKDFWLHWNLVTVRYRADNQEERYIYANKTAWEALKTNKLPYPEGAMFGKVALRLGSDSAFPESKEPKSFSRIQLMKKMATGHAESNGWAYALFIPHRDKPPFAKKEEERSCHACHSLVSSRDYVFGRPAFMPFEQRGALVTLKKKFEKKKSATLSSQFLKVMANAYPTFSDELYVYAMPLFYGSIKEAIGPMIGFAKAEGVPYALLDPNSNGRFLAVVPEASSDACRKKGILLWSLGKSLNPYDFHRGWYCDSEVLEDDGSAPNPQPKQTHWLHFFRDLIAH